VPAQCDGVCDLADAMQAERMPAGYRDGPREGITGSLQLLTHGLLLSIWVC